MGASNEIEPMPPDLVLPKLKLGASIFCYVCNKPHLIAELKNSEANGKDYYFCPESGLGSTALLMNWDAETAIRAKIELQHIELMRERLKSGKPLLEGRAS